MVPEIYYTVPEIWHMIDAIFFKFWAILCPFTPLTAQKMRILKKNAWNQDDCDHDVQFLRYGV